MYERISTIMLSLDYHGNDTQRLMIAYSGVPQFRLRLPSSVDNTSSINVVMQIQDVLNCVTEYHLISIVIIPDTGEVNSLADSLQQQNNQSLTVNPTVQRLSGGNPNTIAQVLMSVSQVFNGVSDEIATKAVSSEHRTNYVLTLE
jgi:hypothetical protein